MPVSSFSMLVNCFMLLLLRSSVPTAKAGGLQLGTSCYHRPLDGRPGNVYCAVHIGIQAETALPTFERGLTLTVSFFAMPTLRTGAACVSGVNTLDLDTDPSRFVSNVRSELEESPGLPFRAVFAPNRGSLSDTCQVFQSECLARLCGFLDKSFTYSMIHIFLKALLTSAHFLETAFRGVCTNLLQDLTTFVVAHTNFMDFRTCKSLSCAISRQIDYPKVNTQGPVGLDLERRIFALSHIQRVDATLPNQVSTANLPKRVNQHIVLAFPQDHTTDNTSLQCIEGNTVKTHKAIGASIVADRAMWAELWAGL